MKPSGSIASVKANPNYLALGSHSYDVWPGYAERYVVQHIVSGEYWAKSVYYDDDYSEERGDWYSVRKVVVMRYEP